MAHAGESLLSRLRDGKLSLSGACSQQFRLLDRAAKRNYAPLIELPARLQDSQPTGSAAATSGTSPAVLPPPPPQPAA
ncbi:MAG TPA: hypothetical protein VIX37_13675, partial [Candidatus Sulfotelmatobacter sp.]